MTVGEAKELLRKRYKARGYGVSRISFKNELFLVSFGEDEAGKGMGPRGMRLMRCNWPTKDPGVQVELTYNRKRRKRTRTPCL